MVERILGKAEVVSSILTGSTIFANASDVTVPQRLFAKRALNPSRHGIADPHDDPEQHNGEDEFQSGNHESPP